MRILLLCPTMGRVGTWFRCRFLAEGLVQRGHAVTLVKIHEHERVRTTVSWEAGIELIETPRFWGSSHSHGNTRLPSDWLARLGLVLRRDFDVVHTFSHHLNAMLPGLVARVRPRHGALVVDWDDLWTDGGLYGSWPERGLVNRADYLVDLLSERYLKRLADGVTVVSHDLVERSLAHGVRPERICQLANGAPVETIHPGDRVALRRQLDLPVEKRILVFVGFGLYDVTLALDALRALGRSDVLTLFVGPQPEVTRAEAERRGVAAQVRVVGTVPFSEMGKYLGAADLGLLPYADKPINRARWPIKLGDYLAAGLPVVTCRVGEMGLFVDKYQVGEATAPNADSFAEGIRKLLALDTGARTGLSQRARQAAEAHSWAALAAQAEAFYEQVVAAARS